MGDFFHQLAGIVKGQGSRLAENLQIVALLRASAEHVRKSVSAMPVEQLDRQTVLYGRNVPQWAVLLIRSG